MTWAIGDIQGCYDNLKELLKLIEFNPKKDKLWFVGDLVNRGKKSLEVLEFLISIQDSIKVVLGNHDISLISAYYGLKKSNPTIAPILEHKNAKKYINWLREKPFLHIDYNLGYALTHAGIAPDFEIGTAKYYNDILQKRLQSSNVKEWLKFMLSKDTTSSKEIIEDLDLERYALNSFIRMRYCYKDGELDFKQKGSPKNLKSSKLYPWFDCPSKIDKELKIVFGHWSTLGFLDRDDILALDTGCIWGGELTAYSLNKNIKISTKCKGIPLE